MCVRLYPKGPSANLLCVYGRFLKRLDEKITEFREPWGWGRSRREHCGVEVSKGIRKWRVEKRFGGIDFGFDFVDATG